MPTSMQILGHTQLNNATTYSSHGQVIVVAQGRMKKQILLQQQNIHPPKSLK